MNARTVTGGLALAVIALLLLWLTLRGGGAGAVRPDDAPASAVVASAELVAPEDETQPIVPAAERVAVEAHETAAAAPGAEEVDGEEEGQWFWARVVDDVTETPIPGARVARYQPDLTDDVARDDVLAESDADGLLRLPLAPEDAEWSPFGAAALIGTRTVMARNRGFGPVLFGPDRRHVSPGTALNVRLLRGAELSVVVHGGGSAGDGEVEVELTASGWELVQPKGTTLLEEDPTWQTTGSTGEACVLVDLPPRVELEIAVTLDGEAVRTAEEELVLEPGERRALELSATVEGVTVGGRLVDEDGEGLSEVEIWIAAKAQGTEPPHAGLCFFRPRDREGVVSAPAVTDASGRFTLDDVPPGRYWIGPAAERTSVATRVPRVAPVASFLEVPPGADVSDVALVGWTRNPIAGRVTVPAGESLGDYWVLLQGDEIDGWLSVSGEAQGRFAIGPLPPGRYSLQASASGLVVSETVEAAAGDDDVLLALRRGGGFRVQLVDGVTGRPTRGSAAVGGKGGYAGLGGSGGGDIHVDGVAPGTYTLFASRQDGHGALVRDVVVRAGATTELGELALEPAAVLELRYRGPREYAQYAVLLEGDTVAADGVRSGTSATVVVPPERLTVQLRCGDQEREQQLSPTVGERREVVFELEGD